MLNILKILKLEQYTENFKDEGIENVETFNDYEDEDLLDLGLKKPHIKRLRRYFEENKIDIDTRSVDEVAFDNLILSSFPFIIANPYEYSLKYDDSFYQKNTHIVFTIYQLLRFTGLLLLNEYFNDEKYHKSVSSAINNLKMPHFNDWITLVNTLAKNVYKIKNNNGVLELDYQIFFPELIKSLYIVNNKKIEVPVHEFDSDEFYSGSPFEIFRNYRNKEKGHAGLINEEREEKIYKIYSNHLRNILNDFSFLADIQILKTNKGSNNSIVLQGSDQIKFKVIDNTDIKKDDYLHIVYKNKTKSLFPLFVGSEAFEKKVDEIIFLIEGYNNKKTTYLGLKTHVDTSKVINELLNIFKDKKVDIKLKLNEIRPWLLSEFIKDESLKKINRLKNIKYFQDFYVTRDIDKLGKDFIYNSNKASLLIIGEAGSGKSSFACNLTETIMNISDEKTVLLMLGNEIQEEVQLINKLIVGFGLDNSINDFDKVLKAIEKNIEFDQSETRQFILFIDAANESENITSLLKDIKKFIIKLDEFNKKVNRVYFKSIITIRKSMNSDFSNLLYDGKNDNNLFELQYDQDKNESYPYYELKQFSEFELHSAYELHQNYSNAIDLNTLSLKLKELLVDPLLLHIFHLTYHNQSANIKTERELWNGFLTELNKNENFRKAINQIITLMLKDNKNFIDIDMASIIKVEWSRKLSFEEAIVYKNPIEIVIENGIFDRDHKTSNLFFIHQRITEEIIFRYFLENFEINNLNIIHKLLFDMEHKEYFPEYYKATELLCLNLILSNNYSSIFFAIKEDVDQQFLDIFINVAVYLYKLNINHFFIYLEELNEQNKLQIILNILEKLKSFGDTNNTVKTIDLIIDKFDTKSEDYLKLYETLCDMTHLEGQYEKAAGLLEKLLKTVELNYGKDSHLYIKYSIRIAHHRMFFSNIELPWSRMIELLNEIEYEKYKNEYAEIMFMLGGNLAALKGNFKEGIEYLNQTIKIGRKVNDKYLLSRCMRKLSDYYRYYDDMEEANNLCTEGITYTDDEVTNRQRIYLYSTQAENFRKMGQYDKAIEYFEYCMKLSSSNNIKGWIANSLLGLSETHRIDKNRKINNNYLDEALKIYESINMNWGIIHTKIAIALNGININKDLLNEVYILATNSNYTKDIKYIKELLKFEKVSDLDDKLCYHELMFL